MLRRKQQVKVLHRKQQAKVLQRKQQEKCCEGSSKLKCCEVSSRRSAAKEAARKVLRRKQQEKCCEGSCKKSAAKENPSELPYGGQPLEVIVGVSVSRRGQVNLFFPLRRRQSASRTDEDRLPSKKKKVHKSRLSRAVVVYLSVNLTFPSSEETVGFANRRRKVTK